MNEEMMAAFSDELEKIKEAGVLRNVGNYFSHHAKDTAKNLAGTAKAFANPRRGMAEGWKSTVEGLRGGGWKAPALLIGGTALAIPGAVRKDDPSGMGASRTTRMGGFVGGQIGGLLGAPYGLSGGLAGGVAGEVIGRKVGKLLSRGGKKQPPPTPASGYVDGPVTPRMVQE